MATDVLSPRRRSASLDALDHHRVDVVVIGGGVTGVGCALDAVARGLTVALVEQRDIAAGTSSRSSKLIHGGLRYLEQLDFGLVREAIGERSRLAGTIAPHLVQPVSFLYPLRHRIWERAYVGAGVGLYDLFALRGDNPLPRHRHLSRSGAAALAPCLDPAVYVGAIRYWDAKVDDARHCLAVARTAAGLGAHILTSTKVEDLLRREGRVIGVRARCLESGRTIEIGARSVINATGVWTGDIQMMAGGVESAARVSKGVHLVVPADRIRSATGIIIRTSSSVLFIIPWGDHWIIGTTDTDWSLDKAHPAANEADIAYLLTTANSVLRHRLGTADITGVYAGLRPLLADSSDLPSKASREHRVQRTAPGLVSVLGGKYTTYRVMARDAVDATSEDLDRPLPPSPTADLPLIGATGFHGLASQAERLSHQSGLPTDVIRHLLRRHGDRIGEVLDLAATRPDLSRPLAAGHRYLRAEVTHAAAAEGALHLDDVLTRRTRLSVEARDRATGVAHDAAVLMATELGWTDDQISEEVQRYQERGDAEQSSHRQPDDVAANAIRLAAPDSRAGAR